MPWPRALTLAAAALTVALVAVAVLDAVRTADTDSIVRAATSSLPGIAIIIGAGIAGRRAPSNGVAAVLALMSPLVLHTAIPAVTIIALLHNDRYDVDDAMAAVLLGVFSLASVGSGLLIGRESFEVAVTVTAAVANAIKHAGAARISVRAHRDGNRVAVVVRDDGRCGARPRPGSGLARLTDRVAAVGGLLAVDSDHGAVTTVKVLLPCG